MDKNKKVFDDSIRKNGPQIIHIGRKFGFKSPEIKSEMWVFLAKNLCSFDANKNILERFSFGHKGNIPHPTDIRR